MAWLTNWNYRKATTISNTGSTLSDYQVLTTIDTAILISAGKMRSDCGDIRFTDTDGSTSLPYWIESGPNTASTKTWIKIPSISAGANTIYMYYGNPSVTSISNGTGFDIYNNLTPYIDHGGADWDPLNGSSIVGYHYNVGTFTIMNGYTVYVDGYNGTDGYGTLTVSANTANIAGILNATGKGWRAGGTNGSCEDKATPSDFNGQYGNVGQWNVVGQAYGSLTSPYQVGSHGGGGYCANGGNGGGLIRLIVSNTTTVNGSLLSDGTNGYNQGFCCAGGGGGGSGGGITILSTNFAGTGTITAKGGNGGANNGTGSASGGGGGYGAAGGNGGGAGSYGGGGAGGRISIRCSNKTYVGTTSATGGSGVNAGGIGTIYTAYTEPTITIGAEQTPSNITAISMTITPNETPCRVGICTVTVDVTWTNNGGSSDDFIPNITIDGAPYLSPYPLQSLGAGVSITKTFVISGLAVGIRNICPIPN